MIELYDGWAISADKFQFILGRPANKLRMVDDTGTNDIVMRDATYHPTLVKAWETFARIKQRECVMENQMTISQALTAFAAIEQRTRDLVSKGERIPGAICNIKTNDGNEVWLS